MLRRMCAGFGMVGMAGLLGQEALLADGQIGQPHFAPRAKRVIFLFMNGGPSHVDTFDPKPALCTYAGQQPSGDLYKKTKGSGFMPSPLEFRRCGRSGNGERAWRPPETGAVRVLGRWSARRFAPVPLPYHVQTAVPARSVGR